jgi:hypothetical protein
LSHILIGKYNPLVFVRVSGGYAGISMGTKHPSKISRWGIKYPAGLSKL